MARKNITLSAEEKLIKQARVKALQEQKSLNTLFQEWLEIYTDHADPLTSYHILMEQLRHANSGRHFSRDELNDR